MNTLEITTTSRKQIDDIIQCATYPVEVEKLDANTFNVICEVEDVDKIDEACEGLGLPCRLV